MLHVTSTEKENILKHMGHTWGVHRDYYRQVSDVIERLDISKLLLIQDMDRVGQNQHKSLQDIDLREMSFDSKSYIKLLIMYIPRYKYLDIPVRFSFLHFLALCKILQCHVYK